MKRKTKTDAPAERPYTPPIGPNHRVVIFAAGGGDRRGQRIVDLYGCGEKCERAFAAELADLSPSMRRFVVDTFAAVCPCEFFHMPPSAGGKYHPRRFGRPGGLVLHTRLVCWWALRWAEAEAPAAWRDHLLLGDELIAACLLHDLCKFRPLCNESDPLGSWITSPVSWYAVPDYCRLHGRWAAAAIKRLWEPAAVRPIGVESIARIVLAVGNHMGRFGERWAGDVDAVPGFGRELAAIVQRADYAAAQRADDAIAELAGPDRRAGAASAEGGVLCGS